MGSAYHWEARRRQVALEQRRQLMQQQQEKERRKLQEEKCQPAKQTQPPQEPHQEPGPSQVQSPPPEQPQPPPPKPAEQPQPPPPPPSPQPQPQPQPQPPPQQNAQDPLTQPSCKHTLQDSQKPGPQLDSMGTHQTKGQSNCFTDKFQGEQRIPPDPGFRKPGQACPANYTWKPRFTSMDYIQQW